MKNYFFKINRKYLENFSNSVIKRFKTEGISSDRTFLRSLFKELNRLFSYIGGRVSSKSDIPGRTDYPDSKQFNKLIEDIAIDLDKLYTAQKLIENDLNNLLNFNSSQRQRTYENLTSTQQKVYSIYIKNRKLVNGEVIIPSDNPFSSADNLSDDSSNVKIEETRRVLTLNYDTKVVKPIDIRNVKIFFSSDVLPNSFKIYPNNKILELGSHWKVSGIPLAHHVDLTDKSATDAYKYMMIDDPNSNTGIGWCEFESVRTYIPDNEQESKLLAIKKFIGKHFVKDEELLYVDIPNSLQGKYITSVSPGQRNHKYKLTIPFTSSAPFTNEIMVSFESNSNGFLPKINWNQSKIYSNSNGTDVAYKFVKPATTNIPENGEYKCVIQNGFVKPSRMELILEYGVDSQQWVPFSWKMSHYIYNAVKNYVLPQSTFGDVSLILKKTYDVFVDAEPNAELEKSRALNVLLLRSK